MVHPVKHRVLKSKIQNLFSLNLHVHFMIKRFLFIYYFIIYFHKLLIIILLYIL